MATLKLKKNTTGPAKADRAPVRSTGVKKRPTLSQAQTQREEREARYQEQLRLRYGDRPPAELQRRGEPMRDDPARGDARRNDNRRDDPRGDQRGGNQRGDARRADPRQAPRRDEPPRRPARPAEPNRFAAQERPRGPQGTNTAFGARPSRPPAAPTPLARPQRPSPHRDDDDDEDEGKFHPEIPGSMRLSKRMSELGIASRREADEWIPKGWVRVDGKVVTELGSRVLPGQLISIEAKARDAQALKVTVLIHKPIGYVSGQAEDGYEPASVLVTLQNQWREDRSGVRFLQSHHRGLAPAGRLDIDSTGLLVLTQDGRIAKQLIGEDSEVDKEYLVRVQSEDGQPLPDEKLALLNHGLELDGEALKPAQVEWVNDDQLRFVLREGKKRQIRRMCELVGLKVIGLKRVRIGNVMLGDLPPGTWRYLGGFEKF
ncbi:MAG: pseudouridine synthase [Rhizobacter sp.]